MFLGLVEFFSGLFRMEHGGYDQRPKGFHIRYDITPWDILFALVDGIGKLFGQDWGISDWFQGVKDSILKLNLGQWAADAKGTDLEIFRRNLVTA